ncbi:MAG: DMT family transporter, partial [Dysgonamonadaceae bacterium]|nr:DMT family transporter [Dysgonamonadaceae bacterium]
MSKDKFHGHLIILVVNVIFALNMSISKSLLPEHIHPAGLTLARIAFACAAFWLTSLFTKKEKVSLKDIFLLFVCGLCGIAFNQGSFIIGLNMTSPVDASILVTSTPLMVMVFAFFILHEPISLKKAGGVLLGAMGAIMLILSENHEGQNGSSYLGNSMVIFSGFIYSIYLVISKPLTQKYSAVTMMKWMFL